MTRAWVALALVLSLAQAANASKRPRTSPAKPPLVATVSGLLGRLDAHDPYTRRHARRVDQTSRAIARELGLPLKEQLRVGLGGLLHDTGKIETPVEILTKRGPLDPGERQVIDRHSLAGSRIIRSAGEAPLLRDAARVAATHHARWDGQGHPSGLAGARIPLAGRIVAVADAYDALTSQRSYNTKRTPAAALAIIREDAGTHFDPRVVEAFARVVEGPAR